MLSLALNALEQRHLGLDHEHVNTESEHCHEGNCDGDDSEQQRPSPGVVRIQRA
jgi:hypothetical protein